jgi:hypothetical protein
MADLRVMYMQKSQGPVNIKLYMRRGLEKEAISCKKKRKRMEILFEIKSRGAAGGRMDRWGEAGAALETREAFVYEC